jgi:hypothetical protein
VVFPSLPQSFEIEMDSLMQEFTAVSGVSELSRFSEAPAGVKSGVALSIANEADDSRISMTANQINIASIDLGRMWLRLYRQFAQEPRLLRHVGNSSEIDLLYWNASDLRSDDVIIDNSSAIAETPSQRRQMVFDLMQTGIFNRMETNPFSSEGVRKIMEMLDLGFWEKGINDDEELQVSKAKRENRMMLEGTLVPPNDYDDDNIHIREHYRFMMTTDYEEILQTEEGMYIEEAFKSHIAAHHERVIMMMQDQIMMEAAPQLQQQQQSQGEQDGAN